ncbi:MAG: RNA polymerase sigma factor [Bacteroidetes bacterium]|nr:RNA polymerase sigma factor [Bacteroidota bacterium]
MTDEQIANGCIEKNAIAQKHLYEKFSRRMMGVCLRYCDSTEEAEDIVQNGFIKVFENIAAFKGSGSLEGWIRKIMINTALTNIRKNKKLKQNIELDSVEFMLPSTSYIYEDFAAKDLLKIIQTLPAGFKTVFNLYAIEGYSHKEISGMLDISEGTSKSQYSRAKAHLQKILSTDRGEPHEKG